MKGIDPDDFVEELAAQKEELTAAIEELEKKNSSLQQTVKELEDRNFELDQIIYRTDHDLKSPISSIEGLCNLLLRDKVPEAEVQELAGMIDQKVTELKDFIKMMVSFTKSLRDERHTEQIDFELLLQQVNAQLQALEGAGEVKLEVQIGEGQNFKGDPARVKALLLAILSNAVRYRDQTRDSWVRVNVEYTDHACFVSISDNGLGMGEEVCARVFEMFYRGSELSTGAGLGLYLAQRIVTMFEGQIQLHSKEGVGTSVEIELPLLP